MNSRDLGLCFVCGDTAIGINFAVPTCAPCKAFFRRNAVKLGRVDFICTQDGDCPVTYKSRRTCNCCRLAKCFRVGMQKSLIRTQAEKESRKDVVQQNRQKRTQLVTIQKSSFIQPLTICPLKQKREEFLLLSDQILLTNIFGAYEQTYAANNNCQYPHLSSIEHSTIHTFVNEYEERFKLLIEYFKLIPEFNRLSMDDKIRLLRNHSATMVGINQQILRRSVHQSLVFTLKNVFQNYAANNFIDVIQRLIAYTYDPVQLKLVLIIEILSSGTNRYCDDIDMHHIYDDTRTIFAGQNVYVELLWRYLLSRLPSERDTVKFFNKLILDLLFLQRCCFAVEHCTSNLDHKIDQMKPLMRSLWYMSEKKNMNDDGIDVKSYP